MPPPRVALGRFNWPCNTAARFATLHALIDTAGLARVRAAVYNPYRAGVLVIDDDTFMVQTKMWMLPPRPVTQTNPGNNEPWLITLVDERYFWWQRAASLVVTSGVTTWANLYAAIAAGLGITLAPDAIPAAYLMPPAGFSSSYEYLPPLLDAVACNVGQRVVRGLDGTVRAMNAQSSRAVILSNLAQGWTVGAGGRLAISWS